jgi:NADPH:quinone reductase-like Zn-dependent oxidoreductase
MKAFLLERYGPPEVLQMAEVERPAPAADEALFKAFATTAKSSQDSGC